MTASGQPRRMDVEDGVYERTRHVSDGIGFGRPAFAMTARDTSDISIIPTGVSLAHMRNGSKHRNVELLQLALRSATGVDGYVRGHFDDRTRLAYAKFQRQIGYPKSSATGVVDQTSLRILGEMTRVFRLID
jgi:hypothetical protein